MRTYKKLWYVRTITSYTLLYLQVYNIYLEIASLSFSYILKF
jgi:hypothetical protein